MNYHVLKLYFITISVTNTVLIYRLTNALYIYTGGWEVDVYRRGRLLC